MSPLSIVLVIMAFFTLAFMGPKAKGDGRAVFAVFALWILLVFGLAALAVVANGPV